MVEAVIWDFGGVITTSPFERFREYEKAHNLPTDFIRGINATNPDTNAWAQFERNEVSIDYFDDLFRAESRAKGHEVPGKDIVALLSGGLRSKMVAALKTCKEHFKVGCITNNINREETKGWDAMAESADLAREFRAVFSLFDVVIESSLIGLRKPDPKIYELAVEKLAVDPKRSVYLDDLGINLKPARALGMTTIKVVDPDEALKELEAATGLSFSS